MTAALFDAKPSTAFNPQANATQARTMEHYRRLDSHNLALMRSDEIPTDAMTYCARGKRMRPAHESSGSRRPHMHAALERNVVPNLVRPLEFGPEHTASGRLGLWPAK